MANDGLPMNVRPLSVTAHLVAGGVEFDILRASVTSAIGSVPIASLILAAGYETSGKQLPGSISALLDGAAAEIIITTTSSGDFPGLPTGTTTLFKGFVNSVGPSISGESGSNIGVQLVHADMTNLMSGSTVQWNSVLNGTPYDPRAYVQTAVGALYGGKFTSKGLHAMIRDILTQFMKSAFANTGASMPCQGVSGLNDAAIAAIAKLKGSALSMRSELSWDTAMLDFVSGKLTDIRAMSVFEQLRALGADLMFDLIPRINGDIYISPSVVFVSEAWATVDGKDIFGFEPEFNPARGVAGVLLMSPRPIGLAMFARGCYVFPTSVTRSGLLLTEQIPDWMSPSLLAAQRDKAIYPNHIMANPSVAGVVSTARPSDPAVEASKRSASSVKTYGNDFARELAMRKRYESCRASFTTYLRTDIGPLSTVAVNSPAGLDADVSIYGRVEAVTLSIEEGSATSTFSLGYVRSADIQEQIIKDGGSRHPIYSDEPWVGGPL